MSCLRFIIICVIVFSYIAWSAWGATLLPNNEVEALKVIGNKLGKKTWDFTGSDPCGKKPPWVTSIDDAVRCNCFSTVCHVKSIVLKSQSLPGILPPELAKLPDLELLDLTRNYLSGSIPREWGTMKLLGLHLNVNRISGSIPIELTNMSTLVSLTLEANHLSGPIPSDFFKLVNLQKVVFSSNNFSGELPKSLANLTNLEDFRISDNRFTGKIPDFIQSWTHLKKIAIQASGLEGPIPLGISLLTNISEMRISDLNGTVSPFPPLRAMKNMTYLVLRSCNIGGEFPGYLSEMVNLRTLDLSFNKLTGEIGSKLEKRKSINVMYLTGNRLTGMVPDWVQNHGQNVDLSYNNFTLGSLDTHDCEQHNVNLFGSSFLGNNSSRYGGIPCLRKLSCPQETYWFHINCGGSEVTVDQKTYEEDRDPASPSRFYKSRNWGFSSVGNFMDDSIETDNYTAKNTSTLSMSNAQLYMNARLSPVSLTYYGFCLRNGNYTVHLHFAEIMFTDDKTYRSLGRRIFDVYIQGMPVKKDFNIVDEADGAGKVIIRDFIAIVTDGTLEIRFHWAGKGTGAIAGKGMYGPLVSAISVDPNYPVPSSGKKISGGVAAGIVLLCLIIMVLGILWWKGCIRRKSIYNQDLRGLDLQTGSFTLRQIKAATNNFNAENKIGEGGFGPVYKGLLVDGTIIAVKQLSSKSKQGSREFVNEIGMISSVQHAHLVKLYGCCSEGDQLLIVL